MTPRRLIQAVLALVLAVSVAPADAAGGELVVYANGPGYVSFTLSRALEPEWASATKIDTKSQYAVLLALADGDYAFAAAKIPGYPFTYDDFHWTLPRGPVTFRVMTSGKTTFRFPLQGSERIRVHATKRLQGGVVRLATARPTLPNVTHHEMPVDIPEGALMLHGFAAAPSPYEAYWLCVQTAAGACPTGEVDYNLGGYSRWRLYRPNDAPSGALHATLTLAADDSIASSLHFLITVPGW